MSDGLVLQFDQSGWYGKCSKGSVKNASIVTLPKYSEASRVIHSQQTEARLQAVAEGVRARGGDEEQIAAAWLHDAVEDEALSEEWLRGAALTDRTKSVVRALTKRAGEAPQAYAARILATPGALLVKEADLAHNADPARLSALDEATRARLEKKYAHMRSLLGLTAEEAKGEGS